MALADLFKNRLFLSYLSGAGKAIGTNTSVAASLDDITQENIAAQSQAKLQERYMKMLKGMLSGNVPKGASITTDENGLKIKAPKPMDEIGVGPTPESLVEQPDITPETNLLGPGPGQAGDARTLIDQQGGRLTNPFSPSQLDDLTASDLAGLGSQDVSRALSGATNVEQVRQLSLTRGFNQQLKTAEAIRKWTATGPVDVPGVGPVTLDQWGKLDAKTKAYAYYAFDTKRRGDDTILSFNDWEQQVDPTAIEQQWRLAEKSPAFRKFFFESKEAGRHIITIGERAETKATLDRIEEQSKVQEQDFEQTVREDLMKDKRKWRSTEEVNKRSKDKGISFTQARDEIQRTKTLKEMDKRVRNAYKGQTIERKSDGWYVNGELKVRNPYHGG